MAMNYCDCLVTQYYAGDSVGCSNFEISLVLIIEIYIKNYISIKVSRRAYGSSCDYTYQCVIGLGLICPSTGSTCTCDNGLYWTGSICGINHFKHYLIF